MLNGYMSVESLGILVPILNLGDRREMKMLVTLIDS